MRKLAGVLLLAAVLAPAAAAATRPVSGAALLAIDRKAGFRNFLPTLMLPGFSYSSWSYGDGVLRVNFRNRAGQTVQWRVGSMTAHSCASGNQASYQLNGNKVWWARNLGGQFAWRCEFALDGNPVRLEAWSALPPSRLAATGLGLVAASAKRY
jgi:hypothetical protein